MNNAGGGGADERLWKPEVDKTGNGYAVFVYLLQKVKIFHGQRYLHAFLLVVGILKIL